MIRIWVLNWNNIINDYSFRAWLNHLLIQGYTQWLLYDGNNIATWGWFVEVTRTNGQTFLLDFLVTEPIPVTLNNSQKVFFEIDQTKIDNWWLVDDDWTWVLELKVAEDYPSVWSYFKIAEKDAWWVLTDVRVKCKIKDSFNLTEMWNIFNWADQLVKLLPDGKFPALDWSNITWISASIHEKWEYIWEIDDLDELLIYINDLWENQKISAKATKDHQWLTRYSTDQEAEDWIVDDVAITPKQAKLLTETQRINLSTQWAGSVVYPHSLWRVPKKIKCSVFWISSSISIWSYENWANNCISVTTNFVNSYNYLLQVAEYTNFPSDRLYWTITNVTATNFTVQYENTWYAWWATQALFELFA